MKVSNAEQLMLLKKFNEYIENLYSVYSRIYVGMKVLQNASTYISKDAKNLLDSMDKMLNDYIQKIYSTTDRIIMDGVPMRYKEEIIEKITLFKQQLTECMEILLRYSTNNLSLDVKDLLESYEKHQNRIIESLKEEI